MTNHDFKHGKANAKTTEGTQTMINVLMEKLETVTIQVNF